MSSEQKTVNISEEMVAKLFVRLCKNTSLIKETLLDMHEELGMSKTEVHRLKIHDVTASITNILTKYFLFDSDESQESHGVNDDDVEEEEWVWFCHRKNHGMEECCDKCDRWYCKCEFEDVEPIRDGTLLKCEVCGMSKPHIVIENQTMKSQDGQETKEERVDEDGSYIARNDKWYLGDIPKECDRKQLVKIMAKALVKFQKDQKLWTGREDSFDQIVDVMDRWFQYDSKHPDGADEFSHIVEDADYLDFIKEVVYKAQRIKDRKLNA